MKLIYFNVVDIKKGQPNHLFFGHGATQDDFAKRDFGTSNQLFYEKKMKTETLINPHFYHSILKNFLYSITDDNKPLDKLVTNAKLEDQP